MEALSFPENLYWAWDKVRRFYHSLDGWYDELAVAKFETNLEQDLRRIAKDFERGRYRMQPLRPLPQPKKADKDGKPQTRQAFWVAVRDKPLSGEFEGFLRLRAGNHRIFFQETAETITIHRVRDRRDAYR